jgi:hypothetical protein
VSKKEGKAFFSEEKKQKTFVLWWRIAVRTRALRKQEFFGPFFQKRTASL